MAERAFYDTVVFALSLNTSDPDYAPCSSLLDVDGGAITWCIVISSITRAEASLREYLDQLELRCVAQGVAWMEVHQDQVSEALRAKRALKPRFEQAGMQSRDIKQIFAAAWARAEVLVTRDRDFFDPKDKRKKGKASLGTSVAKLLRDELGIAPLLPADALERLTKG